MAVRTEIEPLGELTISTHGRGELVSGSVKVVSNGPLESVLDIPVFLNHWAAVLKLALIRMCIKKKVPESSQPISSSRPLTLWLEDERSNRPSDKSNEQPLETGSTQPGLSAIETQQQSEDRRFAQHQ